MLGTQPLVMFKVTGDHRNTLALSLYKSMVLLFRVASQISWEDLYKKVLPIYNMFHQEVEEPEWCYQWTRNAEYNSHGKEKHHSSVLLTKP